MTPVTATYLARARQSLSQGDRMLAAGLDEAAGREASLAAFHAAQRLLFERHNRAFKTHNGVHSEFSKAVHGDPRISPDLSGFLSQSYQLKQTADYAIGPTAGPTREDVLTELERATRFVDQIAAILADPTPPTP